MRILLTGGGTLGSVSPLLAVVPLLKEQGHELFFIGTKIGPERALVEAMSIKFYSITAPKLRRYGTWLHLFVPFEAVLGILQAWRLLQKIKPDVIVSAGGFVSVPVVWVGWIQHIPSIIHQQDLKPGLANRLMAPCVSAMSVGFEDSLQHFRKQQKKKIVKWIGNPVRDLTPTTNTILLDPTVPTVLVVGGGTGAKALNELVSEQLCEFANVIHSTGTGRGGGTIQHPRYHAYELLKEEMKEAFQKADLVVARAGLGTITELMTVAKPAIIIPMPKTHQEYNSTFLEQHNAAVVLDQREQTPDSLAQMIQTLLNHGEKRKQLSKSIASLSKPDAAKQFAELITSV